MSTIKGWRRLQFERARLGRGERGEVAKMAKRRENARPHGIEFTDTDWERVKELAKDWHTTPSALVNRAIGDYIKQFAEEKRWDGLLKHGGKREGDQKE